MNETVGFVPEPNCGRGTVTLIYSCLTTLFLSTWTVCRPDSFFKPGQWFRNRVMTSLRCLLMPEAAAARAITELRYIFEMTDAVRRTGPQWDSWTMKQSEIVLMGGVAVYHTPGGDDAKHLVADGLIQLAKFGKISRDQLPTTKWIDSRSKADWLAKAISLCQVLWFMASIVSRLAERQTVSLLEDMTLSYVVCALIMAVAWFPKPQDIEEHYYLQLKSLSALDMATPQTSKMKYRGGKRTAYVLMAIFSIIHLAASGYPFPTEWERALWIICAIGSYVFACLYMYLYDKQGKQYAVWAVVVLYTVFRIGSTAGAFAAFRAAPAGMYATPSWPNYWFHIG
jgi:hypothetical protein